MPKLTRRSMVAWAALATAPVLAPPCAADQGGEVGAAQENYSLHAQATVVWQGYSGFRAAFSGPYSLQRGAQNKETADATLFLGVRLADGLAFYANPEGDQGFGLQNTLGVAGFTSAEAYKLGKYCAYFRLPRAYFRYVLDLGGETLVDQPSANQLGGQHRADNLSFTVGKFGVPDIFDTNAYAHDPKSDFLNWAIVEAGAFDYAADAWGYTYGAAADWTQSWWSLRAGAFDLSRQPNTPGLQRGFGQFELLAEAEERHQWWQQPGSIKLLFFANRGRMGSYDAALAAAQGSGMPPSTAAVRRYATRPGGILNLQQQILPTLGAFLRLSVNDGSKETFDFTDINQSLSGGLSLQGTQWGRPDDTVGLATAINGIAPAARRYFAAGGVGVLIGDGALPRYSLEKIIEVYYSIGVAKWAFLSLDYQYVDNPAYNPLRGPVSVFAVRAHAEF